MTDLPRSVNSQTRSYQLHGGLPYGWNVNNSHLLLNNNTNTNDQLVSMTASSRVRPFIDGDVHSFPFTYEYGQVNSNNVILFKNIFPYFAEEITPKRVSLLDPVKQQYQPTPIQWSGRSYQLPSGKSVNVDQKGACLFYDGRCVNGLTLRECMQYPYAHSSYPGQDCGNMYY